MSMTSYLSLMGEFQGKILGDCPQRGRRNSILVEAVQHKVEIPLDLQSGGPTGARRHYPLVITKWIDPASPLLYHACCTGERMTRWVMRYYRINETGHEENYFTVSLEDALVASIEHEKPMACLKQNGALQDIERVAFSYRKITWTHEIESKEASDDWLIRET